MAIFTGAYRGAKSCTSGPQPGAWGAMDYYLSAYSKKGGVNTGIYNCRTVRGGRTTSLHGEGRAADFGVRPYGAKYGTDLANALVSMSKELGIQCVIWNRKIWSSAHPHSGWRNYSGVNPHTDHLHVEFTWARANASRSSTAKHFAKVLGGVKPEDVKVGGGGSSGGNTYGNPKSKYAVGSRNMKLHVSGTDVVWLQKELKKLNRYTGGTVDGHYGPAMVSAVKQYQKSRGLASDGIAGKKTINAIKNKKKMVSKPKPKKSSKSAPKPTYAFPLPSRHYFGSKGGGNRSVSGYYGRKFKGVSDRNWLKRFGTQLSKRGWSVGKGKTYLKKSGNDGLYGAEYKSMIRAFQRDQGLSADGLLGKKTWDAAFRNPIS